MNTRIGRLLSVMKLGTALGGVSLAAAALVAGSARAEDAAPAPAPAVKFYGHIEAAFVANFDDPKSGINFGLPFQDKSNDVMLNQIMVALEKPLDTKQEYDFGFKAQGMFGSDARLTHFLGEFDTSIKTNRNQIDVVELYASAHTPWLGAGGMDIKVGQYATPLGVEVIDPNGNTFYTHSYTFSFGLPLKHTGILTTTHANDMFDVYAGVDSGVNTTLGKGDTNGAPAFIAGIGVNGGFGGATNMVLLAHIGPENPRGTPNANSAMRYYIDGLATTKVSDALTMTSEVNYIHDDQFKASGYGFVQYFVYTLSDSISLAARGEIWRDDVGFFVAAFPGPLDFVNLEKGLPNGSFGGGNTTYGEITLGATFKPAIGIGPIDAVLIRPEIRYDGSLNSTTPYNGKSHQFTAAVDLVVHF